MTKFSQSILILGILSILVALPNHSFASTTNKEVQLQDYRSRQFDNEVFNKLYRFTPSAINLWDGSSWSSINGRYEYSENDFKSAQLFSREYLYGFDSESIIAIDSLDVTFTGKFLYNTTRAYDASYNLFYKESPNSSPFYYFTPSTGNWQTQTYFIEGAVSKAFFNRKMLLGTLLSYEGDTYNRVLDIRNNMVNLEISIYPSITYLFSPNHALSVGVNYRRDKMEPKLSNYFPRPAGETNYWVYINKGMGTYEHVNMGYGIFKVSHSFEYSASWHLKGDGFALTADGSYLNGNEVWRTKFAKPQSADYINVAKYDWSTIYGRLSLLLPLSNWSATSLTSLEFNMLDGSGYTYNDQSSLYQKSFSADHLILSLHSEVVSKAKWLNHLGLTFTYGKESALDLNYGQKYSLATLNSTLKVGALRVAVAKGELFLDFNFLHNLNLSNSHDPLSAATNLYTVNILEPHLRYKNTDYFAVSPSFVWERALSKGLLLGVDISGFWLTPYKENYSVKSDENLIEYNSNRGANLTIRFIF